MISPSLAIPVLPGADDPVLNPCGIHQVVVRDNRQREACRRRDADVRGFGVGGVSDVVFLGHGLQGAAGHDLAGFYWGDNAVADGCALHGRHVDEGDGLIPGVQGHCAPFPPPPLGTSRQPLPLS